MTPAGARGRGRQVLGWLLIVATIATLGRGIGLIVDANRVDDATHRAHAATNRLTQTQQTTVRSLDVTNHAADAPIGKAEQVANALSHISGSAGNVFRESRAVKDVLGRAVSLENTRGPGAGRSLYEGEGSDAVRRLQAVLQETRVTLAAAIQAAADLRASAR